MKLPWYSGYTPISNSELSQYNESEEKLGFRRWNLTSHFLHAKAAGNGRMFIVYATVANLFILALSLTLFTSMHLRDTGRNALLKKTSFYSPILDRMNLPTVVKKVNGTLFPGPDPSIARQAPNPEADAIWDELELTRTIIISEEEVRKLGKDPSTVAKFEDSFWHYGENAFMAQIDVFHQLHCLNSLRKLVYSEYYNWTSANAHHPELWYIHNNHCVDILMQNIMCNANTDLYTMQWMETQSHPFPDFSINHQCRDFDALVQWRKENSVDIDQWIAMEKPAGVKQVPAPDEYYEIFPNGHRKGEDVHLHGL